MLFKGAERYRTEHAVKRMKSEDPEPGNLPKASTLRVLKTEYKNSTYLDKDPRKALEIMSICRGVTLFTLLGRTHFLSIFGLHTKFVYFLIILGEISDVSIDASGEIIKSFEVLDGISTDPIDSYLIVVNGDADQYIAAQMISSTYNTVAILHFLNE